MCLVEVLDLYSWTLSTVLDQNQDCGHLSMLQVVPISLTIMDALTMMILVFSVDQVYTYTQHNLPVSN